MAVLHTESQLLDDDQTYVAQDRFKVLVIGGSGVGKGALIRRLGENTFADDDVSGEKLSRAVARAIRGGVVRADMQEVDFDEFDLRRQPSTSKSKVHDWLDVKAVIVLYDVTDLESYKEMKRQIPLIQRTIAPNCDLSLVGTKADGQRQVDFKEAEKFSEEMGVSLFEISSKLRTNCEVLLEEVLDKLVERRDAELEYWNEVRSQQPIYQEVVEPPPLAAAEEPVRSNLFCWVPRIPFLSQ